MKDREDELLDLVDELNDHPEEEFLSGKMMCSWAERVLQEREEERAATLAFLEHAGVTPTLRDMILRGVHRKRATAAMKELRGQSPKIEQEREQWFEKRKQLNDSGKYKLVGARRR